MTKRFHKGQCVYCLGSFDDLASDHVLPRSWYTKTTSPNIEKWQVPACRKCNAEMGKIENRLLIQIGLCVPPFEHESLGIAHKALKSLRCEYGRDKRDQEAREKSRRTIIEKAVDPTEIPLSSILPRFGFHSGVDPSQELGILVSASDLRVIGEKIIRGTTWVLERSHIDTNHRIEIMFPRTPMVGPFFEDLQRFGKLYSLGPGLNILRARADDGQSAIYLIEIWGRLHMYGCVAPIKSMEE